MGANITVVRDEGDGHVSVIYDEASSPPGASATLCHENSNPGYDNAAAADAALDPALASPESPKSLPADTKADAPARNDGTVNRTQQQYAEGAAAHEVAVHDAPLTPSAARVPPLPLPPAAAYPFGVESPTWAAVRSDASEHSSSMSPPASTGARGAAHRRPRIHISTTTLAPTPPSNAHEAVAGTPLFARAAAAAATAAASTPSLQTSSTVASPTIAHGPSPPTSLHAAPGQQRRLATPPLSPVPPTPATSASAPSRDFSNEDVHQTLTEGDARRGSDGSSGSSGSGVVHARRPAPLLQRALHDAQELQQQLLEQRRLPPSAGPPPPIAAAEASVAMAAAHRRAASHEEFLLAQHALEPHLTAASLSGNAPSAFTHVATPWWSHERSFSEPASTIQPASRRPPRAVVGGSGGAAAVGVAAPSTLPGVPQSLEDLTDAGGLAPPAQGQRYTPREAAIGGSAATAVAAAGSLARFAPQQLYHHTSPIQSAATPSWATTSTDAQAALSLQLDGPSPSSSFSNINASTAPTAGAAAAAAAAAVSTSGTSMSITAALSAPPPPQRTSNSLTAPPPPLPRSVHASPMTAAAVRLGSPIPVAPLPSASTSTLVFPSPLRSRRHPQLQHLIPTASMYAVPAVMAAAADGSDSAAVVTEELVVGGGCVSPHHSLSTPLDSMDTQHQQYYTHHHGIPGRSGSVGASGGLAAASAVHLLTSGRRSTAPASTTTGAAAAAQLRSPTLSCVSSNNFLVQVPSGSGAAAVDGDAHASTEIAGSQQLARLLAPLPPIFTPTTPAGAAASSTSLCPTRSPLLPPSVTSTVPGGCAMGSSTNTAGTVSANTSPCLGVANASVGTGGGSDGAAAAAPAAAGGGGGGNGTSTAAAAAGAGGGAGAGFKSPLAFRSPFISVLSPPSSSRLTSQQPQQLSSQVASTHVGSNAAARRPSPISPPPSLWQRQTPLSRTSPTPPMMLPLANPAVVGDATSLFPLPFFAAVTSTHPPSTPTTPNFGLGAAAMTAAGAGVAAAPGGGGGAATFASITTMADGCPLPPGSAPLAAPASGWGGCSNPGVSLSASASLHFTSVLGAPSIGCPGVASAAGHRTFHVTSPLLPPTTGRVSAGELSSSAAPSLLLDRPEYESGSGARNSRSGSRSSSSSATSTPLMANPNAIGFNSPLPRHMRASPVRQAGTGPLLPRQASPLSLPPSASSSKEQSPSRASNHMLPLRFFPGAPPAAATSASPSLSANSAAAATTASALADEGGVEVRYGDAGVSTSPSMSPPHVVLGTARPPLCINMSKVVTGTLATPADDSDCLSTEWTSATTVAAVDGLATQDGQLNFTAMSLGCPAVPQPQSQQQRWHHRQHTEFNQAQRVVAAQPAVRPLAWRVLELYASGEEHRRGGRHPFGYGGNRDDVQDEAEVDGDVVVEGFGETSEAPTSECERLAPARQSSPALAPVAEATCAESAGAPTTAARAAALAAPSFEPSPSLGCVDAPTVVPTPMDESLNASPSTLDAAAIVVESAVAAAPTATTATAARPASPSSPEDAFEEDEVDEGPHVCPMHVRASCWQRAKAGVDVWSRSSTSSSVSTCSSRSSSRSRERSSSGNNHHENSPLEDDAAAAAVEEVPSPAVLPPVLEREDEDDAVDSPRCVQRDVRPRWRGQRTFNGAFAAAIAARSPSASLSRRSGSSGSNASLSAHLTEEQEEALAVERGFSISSILASSHRPSTTTGPGSPFCASSGSNAAVLAAAAAAAAVAAGVSGGWPSYFGNPVLATSMNSGSSGPGAGAQAFTGELSPRAAPMPPSAMQLHSAARGTATGPFWMSTFASLSHSSSAAATTAAAAAAAATAGGTPVSAGLGAGGEAQPSTPLRGHVPGHRPPTPSRSSSVFAVTAASGAQRVHTGCSSSSCCFSSQLCGSIATADHLSVSSPPFAAAAAASPPGTSALHYSPTSPTPVPGAPPRALSITEGRCNASVCNVTRASMLTSGTTLSCTAGATMTSDDSVSGTAATPAAGSRSPSSSSSAALGSTRNGRLSIAAGGSTRSRRASSVTIVGVVDEDVFAPSPVFAAAVAAANAKRANAARSLRARASESLLPSPAPTEGSPQQQQQQDEGCHDSECMPRRRLASGIAAAGADGVLPLADVQLSSPSLGTPARSHSGGGAGDAEVRRNLLSPDKAAAAAAAAAAVRRLHRQRPIPSLSAPSGAAVSSSSSAGMSPMSPPTLLSAQALQTEGNVAAAAASDAGIAVVGSPLLPADAVESPGALSPCAPASPASSAACYSRAPAAPIRRTPSSVARAVASIICGSLPTDKSGAARESTAATAGGAGHGNALSLRPHNATPNVTSLLRPSTRTSGTSTLTTPLLVSSPTRCPSDALDEASCSPHLPQHQQQQPQRCGEGSEEGCSVAASPCRGGAGLVGGCDVPPAPASAPQPSLFRTEGPTLAEAGMTATSCSFAHDTACSRVRAGSGSAAVAAKAMREKRAAPLVVSRLRMQRHQLGVKSSPSPTARAAAGTPPLQGAPATAEAAAEAAASDAPPLSDPAGAPRPSSVNP